MIGDFSPDQPRDESGRWSDGGGGIRSITPRTPGATVELNYGNQTEAFKIQAGGAYVLGYVKNQDFPTSYEFKPTRGEVFYAEVPQTARKQGTGTSLVRDALHLMRANGTETVNMSTTSAAGRALVAKLIREGDISEPIQTAPSGKAEHRILTRRAGDAPPTKPITWPPKPTPYGSQAKTEAAIRRHIDEGVKLIKSVPQQYFDELADAIYANLTEAKRWETLADTLMGTLADRYSVAQSRCNLIARTETARANSMFNQDRQQSAGIENYVWRTSLDERVRRQHRDLEGQVFSWADGGDPDEGHPGTTPNCLPSDSQIQFADSVTKGYRRWYDGELTTIITESGKTLRATPNHPVLAWPFGWVPIGSLREGDHMVEIADQVLQAFEENENDYIPLIGDIFNALTKTGIRQPFNLSRADFHGDGTGAGADCGKVDIVFAARPLTINYTTDRLKGSGNLGFTVSNHPAATLSTKQEFFIAPRHTANSIMRGIGQSTTLLRRESSHTKVVGFAAVAELDPGTFQTMGDDDTLQVHASSDRENALPSLIRGNDSSLVNMLEIVRMFNGAGGQAYAHDDAELFESSCEGRSANMDNLLNVVQGLPFGVQVNRIVHTSRIDFKGHVFNLETKDGFYVSNNFTLKNCRCTAEPLFSELGETGGEGE